MQTQNLNLILPPVALVAGAVIGYAFGCIQAAASRRYARKQAEGKFTSGWSVTPGSMSRVAYLLVALAVTQYACPMFFTPGGISQWFVAFGVVGGYGWTLYKQMQSRRRLA
jgi:hypothetical protein